MMNSLKKLNLKNKMIKTLHIDQKRPNMNRSNFASYNIWTLKLII